MPRGFAMRPSEPFHSDLVRVGYRAHGPVDPVDPVGPQQTH